jgi:hypothetical protein
MDAHRSSNEDSLRLRIGIIAIACFVALVSARPFAGAWNDGSRLASVESIVDHHTFAIDDSIFVKVPPALVQAGYSPYDPDNPLLIYTGTLDKLFINEHYYSDKPYLVSLLIAIEYQVWQWLGGPTFAQRPDLVCYFLTVTTSGLAYVLTIWWLYRLTCHLGLKRSIRLTLIGALGFSTVALPYVRHVNNHILLLSVMMGMLYSMIRMKDALLEGKQSSWRIAWFGLLVGIGYGLDLGLGPVLVGSSFIWILFRTRSFRLTTIFLLSSTPWIGMQLGLNLAIGGVIKPINSVPEYLHWPGSPFDSNNMTGLFRHSPGKLVVYSLALLFGKHGFIGHNLPLFLAIGGLFLLLRRSHSNWPELLFASIFCIGGWGLYSLFSNNYGGACCSIRWFVPFLACGFYIVAELIKQYPQYRWDLYAFASWGAAMGMVMWYGGPWIVKMVPMYWPIQVSGLITWGATRYYLHRQSTKITHLDTVPIPQSRSSRRVA